MNILNAIILGLVEGVTEFLPISSTAHLIITAKLLDISQTEFLKFFEVFIQSGAILAVVFIYWKMILKNRRLLINLLFSFIPTAVTGIFLHEIIKNIFFESLALITVSLLTIGLFFIVFEILLKNKIIKTDKKIIKMTVGQALLIGIFQSLAVVPGVSRAGAVILAMMILGFNRKEAAIYSFLLAVPTILAASIFDFATIDYRLILSGSNLLFLITGFVVSFFSALLTVKWFISFLQNNSLLYFGVYRIALAFFTYFIL